MAWPGVRWRVSGLIGLKPDIEVGEIGAGVTGSADPVNLLTRIFE